jgi:steroid delta-isomerase-like uncharacterized protein
MASFHASTIKVNGDTMDTAVALAQFIPVFSAFPDWHWEVRTLVIDGDDIAVRFTVTGTHQSAFQGIAATGRRVTISQFTFYRLENGKIVEVWDHADMDAVIRQIGQGEVHG